VDQVINAVLVSDPKLRAGFEAINQANADALTASLRPNPTLYMDIQLLPLTRPFTPDATGGPPQQDVNLSYPIDWYLFGKRAANMAVAAHGVKVSEAEFADRVRQRVTDAVVAYYDILEARALLALARQDVTNLERVEAVTRKGLDVGTRSQVDLNRVRLDLLKAQQDVRDAETTLLTAKAKLRAMIGRSDADPNFDVEGSLDALLTADPPPPDEGFELAVRNRPDIQAIRLRGDQARASVLAETRKAYPEITPLLGYTRQYQTKAIGQPDANSWTAAVTMTLPVYDRNQGNRSKAASTVVQNRFDYQSALADLRAEVQTAAQEFRSARANAEAVAGEQLRVAREVLDAVTSGYELGTRPLLDVLDAQRNFRETYRAYITSRANYWRAVFRYGSAIGQQVPR
jgi:cobalt-zinc-cadmium efflux system outer membrane protein